MVCPLFLLEYKYWVDKIIIIESSSKTTRNKNTNSRQNKTYGNNIFNAYCTNTPFNIKNDSQINESKFLYTLTKNTWTSYAN